VFGSSIGTAALNLNAPGWTFDHNVIVDLPFSLLPSQYPQGNFVSYNTLDDVGFVDPAGGNYRLAATSPYKSAGTDGKDLGANIDAINQAIAGDKIKPSVTIVALSDGTMVSNPQSISVQATDKVGLRHVQVFGDNKHIGTVSCFAKTSCSGSVTWDTSGLIPGSHTVKAKATDTSGNSRTSTLITVYK
jgi:Bacterial Ig domain